MTPNTHQEWIAQLTALVVSPPKATDPDGPVINPDDPIGFAKMLDLRDKPFRSDLVHLHCLCIEHDDLHNALANTPKIVNKLNEYYQGSSLKAYWKGSKDGRFYSDVLDQDGFRTSRIATYIVVEVAGGAGNPK